MWAAHTTGPGPIENKSFYEAQLKTKALMRPSSPFSYVFDSSYFDTNQLSFFLSFFFLKGKKLALI